MKRMILGTLVLGMAAGLPMSCSIEPKSEEARSDLASDVQDALAHFRAADSTVQQALDRSAGYAVLPNIGKGAAVVGAAYGRGEVFQGGRRIGYCSLSEGNLGLQLGGQVFSELIIFKDHAAFDKFKNDEWVFAATASAVAIEQGAGAKANYQDGVTVFTHVKRGLMAELSIGGAKLTYEPNMAEAATTPENTR